MLATRIIPTLLCRGRQLVKGERFNAWRSVGLVAQAVRIHQARGVDEIVLLDIGATPEGRGPDLALVEELADSLHSPLTVGGGVRSVEDVRALLQHGADKVVICTEAWPLYGSLINDCSELFGRQAIVASVDYRANMCFLECGAVPTSYSPCALAIDYAEAGAGEILLTSIDREGTMQGYDLDLISAVSAAVDIPVIAHGGCGTPQHMLDAINAGAHAVAAGSMFLFTDLVPSECSRFLASYGIEVRV